LLTDTQNYSNQQKNYGMNLMLGAHDNVFCD